MRVLIAADIFPPVGGGPSIYAAGLANALTEMGDEVSVASLTPGSQKNVANGAVFAVTKKNKIARYGEYFALLWRHARNADVVYAMGPVNAGLPAWLAARLRGKKFVVKVVGDYAWEQGAQRFGVNEMIDEFQQKKYSGAVARLRTIQKFVVRSADAIIVPCEYLKKMVVGWGALAGKVTVIYNAAEFGKPAEPVSKDAGEQWILTVTRLVPWKGIKALIIAFRGVSFDFPLVRLKIIGDGPERDNLSAFAKTVGIADKVEFLGNLPNAKVLGFMEKSEIFVLNSGYEGLSHVLVEALHANCKVMASDVGGNPEIIIPGQTGLLFPYNNETEIAKYLKDILLGRQFQLFAEKNSRENWFQKFNFQTMVSATRELLQTICAH